MITQLGFILVDTEVASFKVWTIGLLWCAHFLLILLTGSAIPAISAVLP